MQLVIPTEPGIFCSIESGHIITPQAVQPGQIDIISEIQLNTMFQLYEIGRSGQSIGYYLYSGFKVKNKGGVLVTYLENKRGKATQGDCVFRSLDLTVYDIANCGSIAISPVVNDSIKSILSEQ